MVMNISINSQGMARGPHKKPTSDLFNESELHDRIIKLCLSKNLVESSGMAKRGIASGKISGFSDEDIESLAERSIFATNAAGWSKIRDIYTASAHDPSLTEEVMSAGLSGQELREVIKNGQLDRESLRLLSRLGNRTDSRNSSLPTTEHSWKNKGMLSM
jgi:hypothetical protein